MSGIGNGFKNGASEVGAPDKVIIVKGGGTCVVEISSLDALDPDYHAPETLPAGDAWQPPVERLKVRIRQKAEPKRKEPKFMRNIRKKYGSELAEQIYAKFENDRRNSWKRNRAFEGQPGRGHLRKVAAALLKEKGHAPMQENETHARKVKRQACIRTKDKSRFEHSGLALSPEEQVVATAYEIEMSHHKPRLDRVLGYLAQRKARAASPAVTAG